MSNLIKDIAQTVGFTDVPFAGRVDLALASGKHLLILEFMRPGLVLDWDHLNRFERYILTIRNNIQANTAGRFDIVTGYIIADGLDQEAAALSKIQVMVQQDMFAMDWQTLFSNAVSAWGEYLVTLAGRAPEDERLKVLLEEKYPLPNQSETVDVS